jgi:hypothetical protein
MRIGSCSEIIDLTKQAMFGFARRRASRLREITLVIEEIMLRKLTVLGTIALGAHATNVQAFDFDPSVFTANGFGTIGAVYSTEDDATYSGPGFNRRGPGEDARISPDVDTRLGLQVIGRFTDRLTATVQVVSEQNYDGRYTPHVEWANLKYDITSDLSVRVGRTAMGSYLFSDSRKVGYAIPWVRAPHEVYDLLPITNSDGVDVTYKFSTGPVRHSLQAFYGENIAELPQGYTGKVKHAWGVFDTISISDLTAKVAYQTQKLYFGSYTTEPIDVTFKAIGFQYDPGQYFIGAEWAHSTLESHFFNRDTRGWYVSGGYRISTVTPYFIVAQQDPEAELLAPGHSTEQRSYSVGVRWDFMSKFNLKAEYQYADLPKNSQGLLDVVTDPLTYMPSPDYTPGKNYSLVSAQINFVF